MKNSFLLIKNHVNDFQLLIKVLKVLIIKSFTENVKHDHLKYVEGGIFPPN